MGQYAMNAKTVSEAVGGGGLVVEPNGKPRMGKPTGLPTFCGAFCRRPKPIRARSCS